MSRDHITKLSVIFLFLCMLLFPHATFTGATEGLLLWYTSVLPTLLPFIILSSLLIKTQAVRLIIRVTAPLLRRLFGVSDYGTFAITVGFLCGYPMGSKVIADLFKEGLLSLSEAQYLLSFCNNASPAFIISFMVLQNMKNKNLLIPSLAILLLSPILCSFLFRKSYPPPIYRIFSCDGTALTGRDDSCNSSVPGFGNLMDSCIIDSIEVIVKVGGYMMLFSIFLSLIELLHIQNNLFCYLLLPSLEITNGISLICNSTLTEPYRFLLTMMCVSFGGFCAICQTNCVLDGTPISIRDYITKKLITTLVTSFLCILYLQFFY